MLGECQPLHLHAGDGLYNEAHVLAALALLHGDAAPPAPGPALHAWGLPADRAWLAPLDGAPPAAGATADSRAPPLA